MSKNEPSAGEVRAAAAEAAQARATALLAEIRKRLGPESQSVPGPQLDIEAADDGILISLTDRQNFSMFPVGSAEPQARVVRMMDAIAMSLESLPGTIVVRGHTDARPYRSAAYDNWRLSAARAQMAYLHAEPRRSSGKAVRPDRGLRRSPSEGFRPSARGGEPANRDPPAGGEAMRGVATLALALAAVAARRRRCRRAPSPPSRRIFPRWPRTCSASRRRSPQATNPPIRPRQPS